MNNAVINFNTEPKVKKEAQKVARELGIPLSLVLNNYLKQFIQTKTVTFSNELPSDYFVASIKQSEEDIKAGRVVSFTRGKDALHYLDKEIANDRQNK